MEAVNIMQGLGLGLPSTICRPSPEHKIRIRSVPDFARVDARECRTQSFGGIAYNRIHSEYSKHGIAIESLEDEEREYNPYELDELILSPSKHLLRKTISMQFPMPPEDTYDQFHPSELAERSFWSPSTVGTLSNGHSPTFSDISDDFQNTVTAHPALHLLSPKGVSMTYSAAFGALTNAEIVQEAVEYGWLIPFVQDGEKQAVQTSQDLSSVASPASIASTSSSVASSDMMQAPSMTSGLSGASTAATSLPSPTSILNRKRPTKGSAKSAYFGAMKPSEERTTSAAFTLRSTKSFSLLAVVNQAASSGNGANSSVRESTSCAHLQAPLQATSMRRSTSKVPLSVQPRQELLDLWAKVELSEVECGNHSVEGATSPRRRVKKWLGKLQKSKSASPIVLSPLFKALDDIKEPQVKRTRSIEQLALAAN